MKRSLFVAAMLLGVAATATAQDAPQAFVGARIIPIEGDEIADGVLVVRNGRVLMLGPADSTPTPAGATRHDVSGKVILPGLVDTHSHIGQPRGGDSSAAIHPEVRVLDAVNVRHPSLRKARAGGITTVNIMPGSGHLMSGQTVYLKLRRGGTIDELAIRDEDGGIAGGMKMANGTNSRRDPPFPGTRARSAAQVRERFVAAEEYRKKIEQAGEDPDKLPPRDLALEALLEVLDGKRLVHHHTHRHDDVLTVLRLQEEFGFRVVLHHVSDGWKVAPQLAETKTPCSIIVVDSPGGKLEARDLLFETGAVLERAGVPVCFHTDDGITDSRLFLRSPALAVRAGMSRRKALEGVTLAAAEMLDLGERVGSLRPGKDADFVILSGDPLSVYTHVLETWVEGEKVFDRADPDDRLFATGGYGAGVPQEMTLCCEERDEA